MAGGQAIDLASVGRPLDEAQLRDMHRLKTGALLQASVVMGAACGAPDAKAQATLAQTMARRSAWRSRWWTTSWT
jgi:farnesyl diphosphate synthase